LESWTPRHRPGTSVSKEEEARGPLESRSWRLPLATCTDAVIKNTKLFSIYIPLRQAVPTLSVFHVCFNYIDVNSVTIMCHEILVL
jgi:hypothetical protein